MVQCPICQREVPSVAINEHIDSGCELHLDGGGDAASASTPTQTQVKTPSQKSGAGFSSFFQKPSASKSFESAVPIKDEPSATPSKAPTQIDTPAPSTKRPREEEEQEPLRSPPAKKHRQDAVAQAQPLAERMRPRSLDDVHGQTLVAQGGVLRSLIETNRVPSMILWGGPGTGKTTIARLIAVHSKARFAEINSTSSGVAECKRLFGEAKNELALTGRRTIIFCDEIHRFSKSQQDVFLAPVEAGTVTLIGATTENPSFKVINALMSRCRVFTLAQLTPEDVRRILHATLDKLYPADSDEATPALIDDALLAYLSTAAAGDARTALNLLDLSLSLLTTSPSTTLPELKTALTTSLLHDRAGEGHYNLISALQKSIRGSDADAALYYLARMLTAGEDPLYVARRLLVIASEDVGLADSAQLPLAAATHAAVLALGMPEARIPLAHCAAALALAPKSVRAYRAYAAAEAAVREPGGGAPAVPLHLRNAPTRLLRDMGAGADYKYNPAFRGGRVAQTYLPDELRGRVFLEDLDLGTQVDPDLEGVEGEAEAGQAADADVDASGDGNVRPALALDGAGESAAAVDGPEPKLKPEQKKEQDDADEGPGDADTTDEKIELEEWEA